MFQTPAEKNDETKKWIEKTAAVFTERVPEGVAESFPLDADANNDTDVKTMMI